MLLAEHPLAGLQRALIERLGLLVAALGLIEEGEIVHASKRVGMLLAEHPLGKRVSLLSDGGCFLVLALGVKLFNLLVEGVDVIGALRPQARGGKDDKYQNNRNLRRSARQPCQPHVPLQQMYYMYLAIMRGRRDRIVATPRLLLIN